MPTYQYACTACDERLEAVQSFTDAPLTECPACQGRLRKVFSAVGVVFKGSGFYKNDSRDKPKAKSNGAGEGKAEGAKSDAKGEASKNDSKGEGAGKDGGGKKDSTAGSSSSGGSSSGGGSGSSGDSSSSGGGSGGGSGSSTPAKAGSSPAGKSN